MSFFVCDQGHSTAASLPPLPESGPAEEAALLDEGKKTVTTPPSANSSATEETETEEVNQVRKGGNPATEPAAKLRRVPRQEASSSHSGSAERRDLEDSGNSSPAKGASPLARRSSPHSSGRMSFGGPCLDAEPDSDEGEHRYVAMRHFRCVCFLLALLLYLKPVDTVAAALVTIGCSLLPLWKSRLWPPPVLT